jgi:hypothetical protein
MNKSMTKKAVTGTWPALRKIAKYRRMIAHAFTKHYSEARSNSFIVDDYSSG